jgi:uncharacterized membrane protein YkvA (DUF1232 family)
VVKTPGDAPVLFKGFQRRSYRLVGDPQRLARLLVRAATKMARIGGQGISGLHSDLTRLVALVKAWLSGEYRDVSSATIISVVAAILYFVVPLDAIPDFILGWGLVDDVAVVSYVTSLVLDELERFEIWRANAASSEDNDRGTKEEP